jgi:hypothetical protein
MLEEAPKAPSRSMMLAALRQLVMAYGAWY